MAIQKYKRKPTGLEYIDYAYEIQNDTMNIISKLSSKWIRIYQDPIKKLCFYHADFANMSSSIVPTNYEEYMLKRLYLKLSRLILHILEYRLTDVVDVVYNNFDTFEKINGKKNTRVEAKDMLDKKLSNLGFKFGIQYKLLNEMIRNNEMKYSHLINNGIEEEKIIQIMVSDLIQMIFE